MHFVGLFLSYICYMLSSTEYLIFYILCGPGVAWWLRYCATSRTVPGSIPGGVTGDFFHGSPDRNHVPWGRLNLWNWVPGISPGVKAAGALGWRSTTLLVPKRQKIKGLNLPGTPWATLACCGRTLLYFSEKKRARKDGKYERNWNKLKKEEENKWTKTQNMK